MLEVLDGRNQFKTPMKLLNRNSNSNNSNINKNYNNNNINNIKFKKKSIKELKSDLKKILTMISKTSTTHEGLNKLHQFMINNPNFDHEKCLSKLNSNFLLFIKRGLANLITEKKDQVISSPSSNEYLRRYQKYKRMYNTHKKNSSLVKRLDFENKNNENLDEQQQKKQLTEEEKKELKETMNLLKARLEEIRKGSSEQREELADLDDPLFDNNNTNTKRRKKRKMRNKKRNTNSNSTSQKRGSAKPKRRGNRQNRKKNLKKN
eukprot:Anaeramoba_flamelloidesa812282_59.p1 GENE.a812282_59~~a812282_59.p1  ORF type:complete len:263 (-),score=72.13 a812282_59:3-791(-)